MESFNWYEQVRRDSLRLIKIKSVSPGSGEVMLAQEILRLLCMDGVESGYTAYGLDALENDPYARQNVFAFIRGKSSATVVLLGHFDIVDTAEYGDLSELALDPERLTALPNIQERMGRGFAPLEQENSSDWLFGRGTSDMKTGVAVHLALIRHYARIAQQEPPPLSLVFLATPDEENESAGVLQATSLLLRLREQYDLHYLGLLNTDYTTSLYPGDSHRYVYSGTVGKLLPTFLCLGRESHAGDPFKGLDANLLAAELIRDLSMNDEWCDRVRGQVTAPPVTLHAADLKDHYDVQLPFAAYFYLNVLTLSTTPVELLERLRSRTQVVLADLLQRVSAAERRWRLASVLPMGDSGKVSDLPVVLSYQELYEQTVQQLGKERVDAALNAEWRNLPILLDSRERSLRLVHCLWILSERQGPAVILSYAPPFYPHVALASGPFQTAVEEVVAAHPEQHLLIREFYPYVSDMSYLRLDPDIDVSALTVNMPLWRDLQETLPGAYSLPLETIQSLNIPVVNWGIYGQGVHQRHESVLMSYSFEVLPQLLYETIERLAQDLDIA